MVSRLTKKDKKRIQRQPASRKGSDRSVQIESLKESFVSINGATSDSEVDQSNRKNAKLESVNQNDKLLKGKPYWAIRKKKDPREKSKRGQDKQSKRVTKKLTRNSSFEMNQAQKPTQGIQQNLDQHKNRRETLEPEFSEVFQFGYGLGPIESHERKIVPATGGRSSAQSSVTRDSGVRNSSKVPQAKSPEISTPRDYSFFNSSPKMASIHSEMKERHRDSNRRSLIKSPIVIRAKRQIAAPKFSKNPKSKNATETAPSGNNRMNQISRSSNGSDKENQTQKGRNQAAHKVSPVVATLKQHPKTKVD